MKTTESVLVSVWYSFDVTTDIVMYEAETPNEEGQEDDELDVGSIFGIVMACSVVAALIGILIVVAIAYVLHDRQKRSGKAELKSTSPDSLTRYAVTMYAK